MARPDRKSKREKRQSIRDKARTAADQKEKGGGLDTLQNIPRDMEFFKPKMGKGNKGKNRISIIPYKVTIDNHPFQTAGELWHECTYWQHKVGSGTDSKKFICLAKTAQAEDKKCPICEYRALLIKKGEDPELAEELKPKQRQLFNLLDHDEEHKGIQLFEISPYQFGFMLDDEDRAQSADFGDKFYGDPDDGLMVVARFDAGSFAGHSFPEIARIDFEERDDLSDEIIDEAVDLDAALKIHSYDKLKKLFFEIDGGGSDEEDDDNEDDEEEVEKPKKHRTTPSTKKKVVEEDDEEDDDEDSDDEDSDDDTPEDSDNNDEDDEVEEKPKKGRKSKNPCPFGHTFGEDCDETDDCDECDNWDDCRDKKDEIEAESRKNRKKK